jgi:hypothetical protein
MSSDISANIVDISANIVDISANTVISTISTVSTVSIFSISSLFTTDVSGATPVVTPPFSIEELMAAHEVVLAKENVDRIDASSFADMPIDSIRPQLYTWASSGFQPLYKVGTLTLNPPGTCSDGVSRGHIEYFTYLTGKTIEQWLTGMDAKTVGMKFTYSHDGNSRIHLHVNKG